MRESIEDPAEFCSTPEAFVRVEEGMGEGGPGPCQSGKCGFHGVGSTLLQDYRPSQTSPKNLLSLPPLRLFFFHLLTRRSRPTRPEPSRSEDPGLWMGVKRTSYFLAKLSKLSWSLDCFLLASIVPKARECGFVLWTFLSNMSNSLIFFSLRMYIQKKSKITQAAI